MKEQEKQTAERAKFAGGQKETGEIIMTTIMEHRTKPLYQSVIQ